MSLAYGAVAIALVVAVVAVAYGSQAPMLGIAEFAPAARQALDAPPTTADARDARGGAAGRRRTTTTTAPSTTLAGSDSTTAGASRPGTTKTPRTRTCYGNPPRQAEDPMTPACMAAIFEGDNGGATAPGVSATEIRVSVLPYYTLGATEGRKQVFDALFEYLNSRFEFYGRRLVPVYQAGQATDAATSRAVAADIASRNVFAALTAFQEYQYMPQAALVQELARKGVLAITRNAATWWTDEALFDPFHPYVWSVFPSSEDLQRNLADFACRSLAGHPAVWAGDTALRTATRRFAVLSVGWQVNLRARLLADALTACTGQEPLRADLLYQNYSTTSFRPAFERLKADGATTVICVCEGQALSYVVPPADAAGLHPEWILPPSTAGGNTDEGVLQGWQSSALGGSTPLRISAGPRFLPLQARSLMGAIIATNPDLVATAGAGYGVTEQVWETMLLLAAGVQAAGPALTAANFGSGLMAAQFPNTGAGAPPYWQPSAGFGPGDHAMYEDYHVAWWAPAARGQDTNGSYSSQGSWCYLDDGVRFAIGHYPSDVDAQIAATRAARADCR